MVESTENKVIYEVGTEKVFPFALSFFEVSDIHCYLKSGDLSRELVSGEFTVEPKDDYRSGANITLEIDAEPGSVLTIVREIPIVQGLSLPENGRLPSEPMENQFDRIIMICQQLKEKFGRSLVLQHGAMIDPGKLFDVLVSSSEQAVRSADEAEKSASNAASSEQSAKKFAGEAADAAAKELANYLPLAGGEMTGDIYLPPEKGLRTNHKKDVFIIAGEVWRGNGHIVLRGQESGYNPGGVSISAGDGVFNKDLHLWTDGKITWDGKDISLGYPNYAAEVYVGNVNTYTAQQDGWIFAVKRVEASYWMIKINNKRAFASGGSSYDVGTCFLPVKKGDVVKSYNNWEGDPGAIASYMHFYPNR